MKHITNVTNNNIGEIKYEENILPENGRSRYRQKKREKTDTGSAGRNDRNPQSHDQSFRSIGLYSID